MATTTVKRRPGRPGRPEHVPTAATRQKVAAAAGGGMRHDDIAIAIGVSSVTLRKWYAMELSVGANAKRLDVLQALYRAATKKGSSSAARVYLQHSPELTAPPEGIGPDAAAAAAGAAAQAAAGPVPAAAKLGKKEQQQAAAVTAQAGTEWAALLPGAAAPLQ